MELDIECGEHISIKDTCFGYVPDGSRLYNVPNDELLNGLVLGHAAGTVSAANWLHMAAALFGTTVVSPFFWSFWSQVPKEAAHRFLTSDCDFVCSSESVSLEWPFEDPVTVLWWFEQWPPEAHVFEC